MYHTYKVGITLEKAAAVEDEDVEVMCEGESFREYEDLSGYEEELENERAQKNTAHLVDPSDNATAITFKAMEVHGISLSATPGRLYRQWKGEQVEEGWELGPLSSKRRAAKMVNSVVIFFQEAAPKLKMWGKRPLAGARVQGDSPFFHVCASGARSYPEYSVDIGLPDVKKKKKD